MSSTRTVRRIGAGRGGGVREEKLSRLVLVSFRLTANFCESASLGLNTRRTSREKAECKQSRCRLHVSALSSDWVIVLLSSVVIGQGD